MADDEESLDDILSAPATPVAEAPETPSAEQPEGPARDEHGRFAPKEQAQPDLTSEQPQALETEEPEGEHVAPVGAVQAERRKRQAAEAERDALASQFAELRGQVSVLLQQRQQPEQPKPEPVKPPDFWENPDKYVEHALNPFQQQIAEMTFRASRAEAIAEFGKDTVNAAQEAIKAAVQSGQIDGQALKAQLTRSRDPVGDVVRWHQSSPAVQEASIRQKLEAEILAKYGIDPTKQPAPSTPSRTAPVVKLPPSLNRIPAGHAAPERDESLDEVLSSPRRRA